MSLIPKKENIILISLKTNPVEKPVRDLRHSCLRKTDKWPSDTKTFSASLIIGEMQIKTIMSYYHTLARKAIIKKTRDNKQGWECGGKGNPAHFWSEC